MLLYLLKMIFTYIFHNTGLQISNPFVIFYHINHTYSGIWRHIKFSEKRITVYKLIVTWALVCNAWEIAHIYMGRVTVFRHRIWSYHDEEMADTNEQLGKILSAQRKFDELKRIHQCFGKFCAICTTCYNPGERYLIRKKDKATSAN